MLNMRSNAVKDSLEPISSALSIDNFILNVFLGVPAEERQQQQKVYISINIEHISGVESGFYTDSISEVTDYGLLLNRIKQLENHTYFLIEKLGHDIVELCKTFIASQNVKIIVKVHKYPNIDGLISGVVYSVSALV